MRHGERVRVTTRLFALVRRSMSAESIDKYSPAAIDRSNNFRYHTDSKPVPFRAPQMAAAWFL